MKKLKVLTAIGTRPEIIRLSCTLIALDKCEAIDHILVHTGQNHDYELNEIFFADLGLRKPDYFLEAAGKKCIVGLLLKGAALHALAVKSAEAFYNLSFACLARIANEADT